ncbi:probable histone-lysine N-methyltransferase set-23 [Drosophila subpulchrella]|uniref:probable histone-lysine N-methyltransferase set-23 n=1 Tax=Drosophila subpulchrella TaxID=1486046 RepID=UPI0018A1A2B0|nr:probable histone-lysine N-methyltransferase set-23 [Drosophila subpulchrella]
MNRSDTALCDDYEHPDSLEYILESVLMPSDGSLDFKTLADEYNSVLLNQCQCNGACEKSEICPHGGQYEYPRDGVELVLKKSSNPVIECNDLCKCSRNTCSNRLVQYGPRKNLKIFDSPVYGSKGLRTTVNIPEGGYICEYAGELLTASEAKRRLNINEELGLMNYVLVLNEYTSETKQQVTIVDPSRRGNIGRYLNHSCEPNCNIAAVRIDCPIPKIGIFAARDIRAQEELCFHYGGEGEYKKFAYGKTCLCAAPNCTGFMPNTAIE